MKTDSSYDLDALVVSEESFPLSVMVVLQPHSVIEVQMVYFVDEHTAVTQIVLA